MLKFRKYAWKNKIYGYPDECGFGDMWAVTSFLLRISEETGETARFFTRKDKFKKAIRQIRPHLQSRGTIDIVNQSPQTILNYCQPYLVKFVSTVKTWRHNPKSKIVAYQFDGNHLSHAKNLPPQRLHFLLQSLTNMGFEPVDIGHYKPINQMVDILSKCQFFVGCPSGMSVVSISVGNPVCLITRQMSSDFLAFMRNCQYRHKSVQMYRTVDEFLIGTKRMSRIGRML